MSDAFDFRYLLNRKVKIKVKGVGQECPTHTFLYFFSPGFKSSAAEFMQ